LGAGSFGWVVGGWVGWCEGRRIGSSVGGGG